MYTYMYVYSTPSDTNLTRGPPELVQHFRLYGEFIGDSSIWYGLAVSLAYPIPVGRRGVISSFKWFLIAFPREEEEGVGVGTLWLHPICLSSKDSMSPPIQAPPPFTIGQLIIHSPILILW
jgi:hypothetical protein